MDRKIGIIWIFVLITLVFMLSGCTTGQAGRCIPQPYECSDCKDNDGDGKIDYAVNKKGIFTGDTDCESTTDICERPASTEVCDGKDNDCDGSVDEGLGSTTCGKGICTRTVQNCVNGQPRTCVPGTPSTEVCNSLDDDCDGIIDEGCGAPDSCSDTDGGYVVDVKGTVSGYKNNQQYSYTDYCNSTTLLKEYYCSVNRQYSSVWNCLGNQTTACSNGECV